MSKPIPSFETRRLSLREILIEDAPAYEKHFVDYEIISQLSSAVPWPYPKDGIIDYIKNFILPKQGNDFWFWGIFMKENPAEMIGGISLWRKGIPEHRGFWLGKQFWGTGIMTEAVEPVMDYAFDNLAFDKLILSNALGNLNSRRVKEKRGARSVGTRPARFVNSQFSEAEIWEITKEEWLQFKNSRLL